MMKIDYQMAICRYAFRHQDQFPGPIKAALIDMDGTLYDSMPFHARAWHRMITELGIEATVDEFFGYEGMTGEATINSIFERALHRRATPDEVRELYSRKTRYFREMYEVKIMPGAPEMLSVLRRHGVTPVLVTGSGQSSLLDRLDDDFDGAFAPSLRVTGHDVTHGKPHPEPYLRALEKAGVNAFEAIAIENAPLGIRSAVAAGVFTIGVTTGPIPRAEMEAAEPDILFKTMTDCADSLSELLYKLNN